MHSRLSAIDCDEKKFANFICSILHGVYVEGRAEFRGMACREGVPVESLAAAAIAEALQERYIVTDRHVGN